MTNKITINKNTLIVFGVIFAIVIAFVWFGGNNPIAQAEKIEDPKGFSVSFSDNSFNQVFDLIRGLLGQNTGGNLGGVSHTNSGYVINEDGTDDDTRIEGSTDPNLLFIDAGNDRVGIGTASPASTLDVSGSVSVGNFTQGGGCTASTTAVATEIWTEAEMIANNCFVYSGTAALKSAAITITLPASTTMTTLLPNAGDTKTWFYDASGYAAATTTTFAAGTGIILMEPNDGDDSNVVIAGATGAAIITLMRRSDTDVYAIIEEISDAD